MGSPWTRFLSGTLLVVALLTGCAPRDDVDDASADDTTTAMTTESPATESATTPATEETGQTSTGSPTTQPSVTVPQLPIGGGADDPGDPEQCVSVSFLGDEIPPGISIVPAEISFSEPLFELGGRECAGDDTPCLSGGFAFTAENDDTQAGICFVGVRATGALPPDEQHDVQLFMTGRLVCPPGEEASCEEFARELAADEQSIPLTPPTQEATSETTTEATTSEQTTSEETTSEPQNTEATEETGSPTD